ncbi:hypothetical protein FHG87_018603 [Trinorchestia longiramus]|nr:hypothetical protein FHG87_018603 [Trinorchestia longiramus]
MKRPSNTSMEVLCLQHKHGSVVPATQAWKCCACNTSMEVLCLQHTKQLHYSQEGVVSFHIKHVGALARLYPEATVSCLAPTSASLTGCPSSSTSRAPVSGAAGTRRPVTNITHKVNNVVAAAARPPPSKKPGATAPAEKEMIQKPTAYLEVGDVSVWGFGICALDVVGQILGLLRSRQQVSDRVIVYLQEAHLDRVLPALLA